MAIHINPAHKGELHRNLGIAQGKPISLADLMTAKHSKNPKERKRATFAANARTWNKD